MAKQKQTATDLPWRTTLRLPADAGAEIDRLATRDAIPSATVCRILIMERLDQLRRERERSS